MDRTLPLPLTRYPYSRAGLHRTAKIQREKSEKLVIAATSFSILEVPNEFENFEFELIFHEF